MTTRSGFVGSLVTVALACAAMALPGASAQATMTDDEMHAAWREAAQRFEAQHALLPEDSADSRWVHRVGEAIVEAWPDRRWVGYSFPVVTEPNPGAWSFPISPVRHKVYVTSGLVDFIRGRGGDHPDDLLAGVLGHEIAHLMRDHHLLHHRRAEMLELEMPADLAQWPARVLGKWQEEDEFEADSYGAFYALHAGYQFEGIVQFLAHYLRCYGDDQIPDGVGDARDRGHPSLSARVAHLQQERGKIEEAKQLFECGLDLLRVGAWATARSCFAQVRNTFPCSPTVAHNLAYAELKQYEVTLPAGPPLPQAVSTCYVTDPMRFRGPPRGPERALLAEAKADFLKACDLDPKGGYSAPRLGLACVYLYEGEDVKASTCLQEVQVGSDTPEYLNITGVVAERRADLDGARRAYLKSLNLPAATAIQGIPAEVHGNPQPYLPALHNLARFLESTGRRGEAAALYRLYLSFEGERTSFGVRARDGVLRCGGELPELSEAAVTDSFLGIDLGASGPLVVTAALGEPERTLEWRAAGRDIVEYDYPGRGITVVLAPNIAGDLVAAVVALSPPNRDPVGEVRVGDAMSLVEARLGKARAVTAEAEGDWWDYSRYGVAFLASEATVRACLIGGRR